MDLPMTEKDLQNIEESFDNALRMLSGKCQWDSMHYIIRCCKESVQNLMTLSGKVPYVKLGNARSKVSDITLMMGKIARRISSPNLGEIIMLRYECISSNKGIYGINLKKQTISAFTNHLEKCMMLLATELEFLDAAELASVWPELPARENQDEHGDIIPDEGMTADDANEAARTGALDKLDERLAEFSEKADQTEKAFSAIADAFERSLLPEGCDMPDSKTIKLVLSTCTKAFYDIYEDSADGDGVTCSGICREDTPFTGAQNAAINAVERYLDAALRLAKRSGASSAREFASVRHTFIENKDSFMRPTSALSLSAVLDDFVIRLGRCHNQLLAELEASKIAPDKAVAVTLDKSSGKIIESAIHSKPAEKDYFSDANLRILFECGINTPANWRRGKSPPEGFTDAFLKHDYKAMQLCAERYKANRGRSDAMNSKHLVRNISEEQINRESL